MQGRFANNLKWSLAGFSVSFVSGIVVTPFLVRKLGLQMFGIAALTTSVIAYVSLITSAINNVAGRYWVESLKSSDEMASQRVFSTTVISNGALMLLSLAFGSLAADYMVGFCNIPAASVIPFKITFWITVLTVAVNQMGVSYAAISFAYNRLDVHSLSGIISSILRMGMIFLLIGLIKSRVELVAVAGLIASIAGVYVFYRYAVQLVPALKLSFQQFDPTLMKKMMGDSAWILLTQLGTILFLRTDVILAGHLYGIEGAAKYAAVLAIVTPIHTVGSLFSNLFGPKVTKLALEGCSGELASYVCRATKLVGFIIALPTAFMWGFSEDILRAWVGLRYTGAEMNLLFKVLSCHLCVTFAVLPMINLQVALRKMQLPSIMTWILVVLNIGLILVIAKGSQAGILVVGIVVALCLVLKNAIFTPIHCARILRLPWWTFFKPLLIILCVFWATAFAQSSYQFVVSFTNPLAKTGQVALALAIIVVLSLKFLTPQERNSLANLLKLAPKG